MKLTPQEKESLAYVYLKGRNRNKPVKEVTVKDYKNESISRSTKS